MRPGLEPRALGFLDLKPGPSLLKARAKPCLGPGLRGPGRAGLRALSPARHITRSGITRRIVSSTSGTSSTSYIGTQWFLGSEARGSDDKYVPISASYGW